MWSVWVLTGCSLPTEGVAAAHGLMAIGFAKAAMRFAKAPAEVLAAKLLRDVER